MVNNYPSYRLIVILSLLSSSYSQGAIVDSDVSPIISPFDVAGLDNTEASTPVSPFDFVESVEETSSQSASTLGSSTLQPILVGVFVNGQEQGNFDALYDSSVDREETTNPNDYYYLSIENISQLTAVTIVKSSIVKNSTIDNTNNDAVYQVKTPIGDVNLTNDQVMRYSDSQSANNTITDDNSTDNNITDYISLSTLKALGISAEYHPQDLAIKLNMGWRPQVIQANNDIDTNAHNKEQTASIDYYPDKAGLLGISFNSAVSVSERRQTPRSQVNQNNAQNDDQVDEQVDDRIMNRQTIADIGAFGYAGGGIWGVKGIGRDAKSSDMTKHSDDRFSDHGIDAITTLPWDWQDWDIDNLYWTKAGKKYATRIGTNQPNALDQGATTGGSDFTGVMVAYSNRDVTRHLTNFDDNSRSLLENTSQDYQHLTGMAEPGGVAELRINSRPIARVQIGLDGRYEFLNLDVNGLDLTDTFVEIAIYEYPTARQPLEVRPTFLGKRRTNVATGEVLVEAGLGRSGNLFIDDTSYDDSHTATHIYTEYGVNNRLAIRGGINTVPSSDKNNFDKKYKKTSKDTDIAWHAGINIAPTMYSNADISYAHSPVQDLWQVDLNYQRHKLWLDYRYLARQYEAKQRQANLSQSTQDNERFDQRHQLLLSYRPSERTTININQYYNDLDAQSASNGDQDDYYVYTSVYRRFNESLTGGVNWDSRDNRYGYRLLWQDIPNLLVNKPNQNRRYQRNSLGLSGNNDSETLSLRHALNNKTSLAQSISHLHNAPHLLYQGDISHKFGYDGLQGLGEGLGKGLGLGLGWLNGSALSNQLTVGYSLYNSHFGWQADWQLAHKNGVNFSLGYQHRYVNNIPDYNNYAINTLTDNVSNNVVNAWQDKPWGNENYLYARLSFDLFKSPRQPLRFGRITPQRQGNVVVDIAHPPEPVIDTQSMRFLLNNQKVDASLISAQETHSQYLLSNIRAGDYTLKVDAKNLPIEFSTSELLTPSIRVNNYAPTFVPIALQKTYGISGKLADDRQGLDIGIYQQGKLIQTVTSGSYGYFQAFGLSSGDYELRADGYQAQSVTITDDFVLQIELEPVIVSPIAN